MSDMPRTAVITGVSLLDKSLRAALSDAAFRFFEVDQEACTFDTLQLQLSEYAPEVVLCAPMPRRPREQSEHTYICHMAAKLAWVTDIPLAMLSSQEIFAASRTPALKWERDWTLGPCGSPGTARYAPTAARTSTG